LSIDCRHQARLPGELLRATDVAAQEEVIRLGAEALAGKLVLDVTATAIDILISQAADGKIGAHSVLHGGFRFAQGGGILHRERRITDRRAECVGPEQDRFLEVLVVRANDRVCTASGLLASGMMARRP